MTLYRFRFCSSIRTDSSAGTRVHTCTYTCAHKCVVEANRPSLATQPLPGNATARGNISFNRQYDWVQDRPSGYCRSNNTELESIVEGLGANKGAGIKFWLLVRRVGIVCPASASLVSKRAISTPGCSNKVNRALEIPCKGMPIIMKRGGRFEDNSRGFIDDLTESRADVPDDV